MGNGSGLKDLPEEIIFGGDLKLDQIESATQKALSNFGQSIQIFMSPKFFMMSGIVFEVNPQYHGTPWATTTRMTKREHAVAGLHTTLFKLGLFKKLSEDNVEKIKQKTIKRLKRARWARYQQSNKTGQS